eukprot:729552-Rhodomonas_salina.2
MGAGGNEEAARGGGYDDAHPRSPAAAAAARRRLEQRRQVRGNARQGRTAPLLSLRPCVPCRMLTSRMSLAGEAAQLGPAEVPQGGPQSDDGQALSSRRLQGAPHHPAHHALSS